MKKQALLLLAGIGCSMAAHADTKALAVGTTTDVATTECQALDEDVSINLSANVLGDVNCPDTYTIQVATCHEAGRQVVNDTRVNIFHGTSAGGSVAADTSQTECTAATAATVSAKATPGS